MSEPFLAEIKIFGFNFAPRGWAFCDGQILPINQNQSLYSLLGTTYGGDGRTSFALPDIRSRTPIHVGNSGGSFHALGQKSGGETHVLQSNEMPQHEHVLQATTNGADNPSAKENLLGESNPIPAYADQAGSDTLASKSLYNVGGGQAHNNMQPYLTVNYCIALRGLFPSRN